MKLKRKVKLTVTREGNVIFSTGLLRVDFTVDKMIGNALNTAKIEVYNLADTTVSAMVGNKPAFVKVKLEVANAVDTEYTTLFDGDLINMHHTPMFEDSITSLWCWEKGMRKATEAPEEAKVYRNLKVKDLVETIAKTVKDSKGNLVYPTVNFDAVGSIEGDNPLDYKLNSYNFNKAPLEAISEILGSVHLLYTIRNGIITVSRKMTKEGQEAALAEQAQEGVNKHEIHPWLLVKPVAFSIANVEIPYRLSPEINPLDFITVLDKDLQTSLNISETSLKLAEGIGRLAPNTYYQILSVQHVGSCYTDDWYTNIKGYIYKDSIKG